MINAIIKGIFSLLISLLNVILLPINALVENLLPDLTNLINTFNLFITTFFNEKLGYFFHFLPPITSTVIILWLTIVIGYYTIFYSYLAISKIWTLIQKIKFW